MAADGRQERRATGYMSQRILCDKIEFFSLKDERFKPTDF